MACQSSFDCNQKGYCANGSCTCDVAWFGEHCSHNLQDYWPKGFGSFRILFLILFSIFGLAILVRLIMKTMKESKIYGQRALWILYQNIKSPFTLVMVLVLIICLAQIIWLAIDPFVYNNIFGRSLERFLSESGYVLLFIIYAIVLWVWNLIYIELSERDNSERFYRLLWFRIMILLFILFAASAHIIVSVLKGFRNVEFLGVVFGLNVVLFFLQALFVLIFSFYGVRLYMRITNTFNTYRTHVRPLKRFSSEAGPSARNLERVLQEANPAESKGKSISFGSFKSNSDGALQDIVREYRPNHSRNITLKRMSTIGLRSDHGGAQGVQRIDEASEERSGEEQEEERYDKKKERGADIGLPRELPLKTTKSVDRNPRRSTSMCVQDIIHEKKVRDIIKKDQKYFAPIKKVELCDNLACDVPIILTDAQGLEWDVPDEEAQQKVQIDEETLQKRRQELKADAEKLRKSSMFRNYFKLPKTKSQLYSKRLLSDPEHIRYLQDVGKSDKAIIKRIIGMTVVAIIMGVVSAIITLIVFFTDLLDSPGGVLIFMWVTYLLEVFAIFTVFRLFTLVHSEEKQNLQLIYKIGKNKNRINKLYRFELPSYLQRDSSKRKLQQNINFITTQHSAFLTSDN